MHFLPKSFTISVWLSSLPPRKGASLLCSSVKSHHSPEGTTAMSLAPVWLLWGCVQLTWWETGPGLFFLSASISCEVFSWVITLPYICPGSEGLPVLKILLFFCSASLKIDLEIAWKPSMVKNFPHAIVPGGWGYVAVRSAGPARNHCSQSTWTGSTFTVGGGRNENFCSFSSVVLVKLKLQWCLVYARREAWVGQCYSHNPCSFWDLFIHSFFLKYF